MPYRYQGPATVTMSVLPIDRDPASLTTEDFFVVLEDGAPGMMRVSFPGALPCPPNSDKAPEWVYIVTPGRTVQGRCQGGERGTGGGSIDFMLDE